MLVVTTWLIWCSVFSTCFCNCGIAQHSGREFVFGIPENGRDSNTEPMVEIFMININPTVATTTIYAPAYYSFNFPIYRDIDPYGRGVYKFTQTTLVPSGTGTNNRGIRIVSNIDIVVQASNTGYRTSDGFIVYPKPYLGTKYMVASYAESSELVPSVVAGMQGPYQLLVTSATDDTVVTIHFQFCTDNSILVTIFESTSYYCGDTITTSLDAYHNLQIQSSQDLSGTVVEADSAINVVSGAYWGSVGSTGYADYMVDSMLPLESLGDDYLVPPVQSGDGYALKIIGTEQSTSVYITYNDGTMDNFTIDTARGWTTFKSISAYAQIQSSHPVLALQFSMYDSSSTLGDPSMVLLKPTCSSSSSALIIHPYYLKSTANILLTENVEIVALVPKDEVSNLRAYALVQNSGIEDSCVSFTEVHSDFLDYSVVYVPWNGDKNTLIRGRLNTNIFVYTRGVMWSETHSTSAGYLGSGFGHLDSLSTYCGDIQTTQEGQTTTEAMTTSTVETTEKSTTELEVTTEKNTTELEVTTEKSTTDREVTTETTEKGTTEEEITTETTKKSTTEQEITSQISESTTEPVVTTPAQIITETTISLPSTNTAQVNHSETTMATKLITRKSENVTQKFAFEAYQVPDLKEVHEPVESPIALQLGGSCVVFVVLFIAVIIAIDMPLLYRHTKMFIRNIKSIFHTYSPRRRKLSDQLQLTDADNL